MKIDFTELLKAQKELDQVIIGDKKIENLTEKKLVALSVELSELFNEIRCFKYWSNKGMSKKEVVLEEFVDVLHFWLSLANDIELKYKHIKSDNNYKDNLCYGFLELQDSLSRISVNIKNDCEVAVFMVNVLKVANTLGFTEKEIIEAYYKKRDINFKRQIEGY